MPLTPREKAVFHLTKWNTMLEVGKPKGRPVTTEQLLLKITPLIIKHRCREFMKEYCEEFIRIVDEMNEEELNSLDLSQEILDEFNKLTKGNTDPKLDFRE